MSREADALVKFVTDNYLDICSSMILAEKESGKMAPPGAYADKMRRVREEFSALYTNYLRSTPESWD